jgi:hypothetical protein
MGGGLAIFNRVFLTRLLLLCGLLAAGMHVMNGATGSFMRQASPQVTKHYAFGMAHPASSASRSMRSGTATETRYVARQLGVQQPGPIVTAIEDFSALLAESPIGFLIAALILGVALIRYRTRERSQVPGMVSDDNFGDKYLARVSDVAHAGTFVEVPRELLRNPFSAAFDGLGLAERVSIAAEASARAGRRIGTIVLKPPASLAESAAMPVTHQQAVDGGARQDVRVQDHIQAGIFDQVVAHLRSKLRSSDYAGIADGNTIVIFVSLLKTRDDLLAIARRMQVEANAALRASGVAQGISTGSVGTPGIAIYPLDGYDASDLYETARLRCGGAPFTDQAALAHFGHDAYASRVQMIDNAPPVPGPLPETGA